MPGCWVGFAIACGNLHWTRLCTRREFVGGKHAWPANHSDINSPLVTFHAIGVAFNNLLAALIDNHIHHHGNN